MNYVNDYLSYSRVDLYKKCPKAFEESYVKGNRGGGSEATQFGSAVHAALETYFKECIDNELSGEIQTPRLIEYFEKTFAEEKLTNQDLHAEGHDILRRFAVAHGPIEPLQVRGCEVPFELPLGRFTVKGFIDRVDDLGDGHLEIIDYKTNRQPYSEDELENSMQLSLYQWVAQQLFPWAKKFTLSYWMLRMGYKQSTDRTPEELAQHIAFFQNLGEQTEQAPYPAKLNALCGWCDHRDRCDAFQAASRSDATIDLNGAVGLDALVLKREALAGVMNAAKNAKDAIDAQIKDVLNQNGDFSAGGKSFRFIERTSYSYDIGKTMGLLRPLQSQLGLSDQAMFEAVASVDAKKLKDYLKKMGADGALAQAEIDAAAKPKTTRILYSSAAH